MPAKPSVAVHAKAVKPPKLKLIQLADLGPLADRHAAASVIVTGKPAATPAQPGFEPAPLPNPDADAPHGGGTVEPRLSPALLSRKAEFLGNGFSNASSLDYGAAEKRQPAAGLNLLVPVIQ